MVAQRICHARRDTNAMSQIITLMPQHLMLQWAADHLAMVSGLWVPDSKAVGVVDDDTWKIRAVLVLNKFSAEGCEASFVSDGSRRWASASIIAELISSPFRLFNVNRVVAHVRDTDTNTQIFCLRHGFRFEARVRAAMPDGQDAVLFSMLRADVPANLLEDV